MSMVRLLCLLDVLIMFVFYVEALKFSYVFMLYCLYIWTNGG